MSNHNSYIVDGIRTPIGSFGGALSQVRADDMLAHVIETLVNRNSQIPLESYSDVISGCANQAGDDNRNVARMSLLLAGLPQTVPGETVNRLCASGMSAVIHAHRSVLCGDGDFFIASGVENMTRGPWVLSKASSPFGREQKLEDSSFGWRFVNPKMHKMYGTQSMGETAENLAEKYDISKCEQNEFALLSQQKCEKAQQSGRLAKEIIGLNVKVDRKNTMFFDQDEFPKPASTMESLDKLKSAFKKEGSVTAGNSSGLNDGAASLIVASKKGLEKTGLKPLAEIISSGRSGVEPAIMGIGPVEASRIALEKACIDLKEIDHIEINEAFASQVLSCLKMWGLKANDSRINPNGGAIALGHPLGMSGVRILYSAALELALKAKRFALVTMCVGVGQGYAVVLKNPNL